MPPIKRAAKAGTLQGSKARARKASSSGTTDLSQVFPRFMRSISAINLHFQDIHQIWAGLLGISETQWVILLTIDELDNGNGVSGSDISAKIHIHPTFVTTQTKALEKAGFLSRITSSMDARFVLMSLTDKARQEIAKLSERRNGLNESILAGVDPQTLLDVADVLAVIEKNAEKAARRLSIDI